MDYPESLTPNDNLALYYADEIDLPEGFRRLVDGFHALDTGDMNAGLLNLSHPTVAPTYPEKIIDTFVTASVRHKNTHSHEAQHTNRDYSLAIAYITAKSPAFISQRNLDVYMSALCSASVYAALNFTRGVSDIAADGTGSVKSRLLKALIHSCLKASASSPSSTPSSFASQQSPTPIKTSRPRKNPVHNLFQSSPSAWRLANLPFTPAESETVEQILNDLIAGSSDEGDDNNGGGILERRKVALAKDVLLLRALHTGDMEAASKVSAMGNFKLASAIAARGPASRKQGQISSTPRSSDQQDFGVEWTDLARGLSRGLNA